FLAIVVVLWIVARAGNPTRLLIAAAAIILLARAYGMVVLSEVWNSHLPLLWWLVCIFAAWAVVAGDWAMLLVLVAAGSLCAQSYAGYLLPVAALIVMAVGAMGVAAIGARQDRRRVLAWLGAGVVLLVVLWIPVLYEELTNDPGNLTLLWEFVTGSDEEPIGWDGGLDVVLLHLDPWRIITGELWGDRQSQVAAVPAGSGVPGAVLLFVWLAAVVVSTRLGDRGLRRLHLVAAVTLVASILAVSRIIAPVFYWTVFFLWAVQAVLLASIGWTIVSVLRARGFGRRRTDRAAGRAVALAAGLMVVAVWSAETIVGPRLSDNRQSQLLAALMPDTIDALAANPTWGRDGSYFLDWSDPVDLGSGGFGMVNELERAGFSVVVDDRYEPQVWPHRVVDSPDGATAIVELFGGRVIADRLARPGAVQVAYADLRTDAERQRYETLRGELLTLLGPDHPLRTTVDDNTIVLGFTPGLDPEARTLAGEMIAIGVDMAVVVRPPDNKAS
ncbi:MAG: hypothetical protein ACRDZ2_08385, partial [Ilumatobacteraceae bacterium]